MSKLRGLLSIASAALGLMVSDVIQRTLVSGAARLFPSRRPRILYRWQRAMAHMVTAAVRLGGARIGDIPRIEARPGTLILMNHQSLLDIPIACLGLEGGYPRIVTRERYARGIPLISHMTRLYQYPTVDPRATMKNHLRTLRAAARDADTPLVIFPEGTRSRDGSLGRFRTGGLRILLAQRPWEVYLRVVDGFWMCGRFADFVENVGEVRGRHALLGPFPAPARGDDVEAWVEEMHARMENALAELRGRAA